LAIQKYRVYGIPIFPDDDDDDDDDNNNMKK
jgi:hypothetical protein